MNQKLETISPILDRLISHCLFQLLKQQTTSEAVSETIFNLLCGNLVHFNSMLITFFVEEPSVAEEMRKGAAFVMSSDKTKKPDAFVMVDDKTKTPSDVKLIELWKDKPETKTLYNLAKQPNTCIQKAINPQEPLIQMLVCNGYVRSRMSVIKPFDPISYGSTLKTGITTVYTKFSNNEVDTSLTDEELLENLLTDRHRDGSFIGQTSNVYNFKESIANGKLRFEIRQFAHDKDGTKDSHFKNMTNQTMCVNKLHEDLCKLMYGLHPPTPPTK
jgi:hypothetical protein